MKTKLFSLLAIVALLVSCGDSKLPSDGVFGEIPNMVLDYHSQKSALTDNVKANNAEELKTLFTKYKEMNKAFEEQMEQATEKYKGKEIPTEVDKNVFIKFDKPFTIEKIDDNGIVTIFGEGELTAEGSPIPGKGVINYDKLAIVLQNSESEGFYTYNLFKRGIEGERKNDMYPKGTKIKFGAYIKMRPWNIENMANAKSIIVTDSSRDIYTNAKNFDKDAEKAMMEAAKASKDK